MLISLAALPPRARGGIAATTNMGSIIGLVVVLLHVRPNGWQQLLVGTRGCCKLSTGRCKLSTGRLWRGVLIATAGDFVLWLGRLAECTRCTHTCWQCQASALASDALLSRTDVTLVRSLKSCRCK